MPASRREELRSFLFLTVVMAPVFAVAIVGSYGFVAEPHAEGRKAERVLGDGERQHPGGDEPDATIASCSRSTNARDRGERFARMPKLPRL
jgi:hypothetical protein